MFFIRVFILSVVTSSGDVKIMPKMPEHVCKDSAIHLLCQCCLQPMPDRRNETPPPIQQCKFEII